MSAASAIRAARAAGVELGKSYPHPIMDHKVGRERALKAYAGIRSD